MTEYVQVGRVLIRAPTRERCILHHAAPTLLKALKAQHELTQWGNDDHWDRCKSCNQFASSVLEHHASECKWRKAQELTKAAFQEAGEA